MRSSKPPVRQQTSVRVQRPFTMPSKPPDRRQTGKNSSERLIYSANPLVWRRTWPVAKRHTWVSAKPPVRRQTQTALGCLNLLASKPPARRQTADWGAGLYVYTSKPLGYSGKPRRSREKAAQQLLSHLCGGKLTPAKPKTKGFLLSHLDRRQTFIPYPYASGAASKPPVRWQTTDGSLMSLYMSSKPPVWWRIDLWWSQLLICGCTAANEVRRRGLLLGLC